MQFNLQCPQVSTATTVTKPCEYIFPAPGSGRKHCSDRTCFNTSLEEPKNIVKASRVFSARLADIFAETCNKLGCEMMQIRGKYRSTRKEL